MGFGRAEGRYFNPCGIGYPFHVATPAPHVEINFPHSGIDRRIGGAFLEDEDGVRYVSHSGKIGGGAKGVSLTNFRAYYPAWSTADSGGQDLSVYVLARLDDPRLVQKVATFTRVSAEFRAHVKAGKIPGVASSGSAPATTTGNATTFSPEFVGTKAYTTAEKVEAECTHGLVVKALRERLSAAGISAGNTVSRDLYVSGATGPAMLALFEVKTLADTTNVYGCVGQLMVHGGAGAAKHLVAVLPDGLKAHLSTRLTALGLRVVTFEWSPDETIAFEGLDDAITAMNGA
jgi:hypothetical protein